MNGSPSNENHPVSMSVRLKDLGVGEKVGGGLVVTAPVVVWLDQPRVLAFIEWLLGNCPVEIPDDRWVALIMALFELSEARRPHDDELDELEWRLVQQEDLAARFVVQP